jgi:hypothetical protein
MKLLQAFESFLPMRPIVEIDSENWLVAGHKIWQRKLVRCKLHHLAAKTICCWRYNFSSESYFATANTFSAENANSLQTIQFR